MSREAQDAWVAGIEANLQKKVASYRRHTADKRTHNFKISLPPLLKGIRDRLREEKVPKATIIKVMASVMKDLSGVIKKVHDKVEQNKNQYANVTKVKYVPGFIYSAIFSATAGKNEGQLKKIYAQAVSTYKKELDKIAEKIAEKLGQYTFEDAEKSKRYWNLSHAYNEGVSETQIKEAFDAGIDATEGELSHAEMMAYLNQSGVDIQVIRDTGAEIMTVAVGSTIENAKDAADTKERAKTFKEVIQAIRDQLDSQAEKIAGMPGSDSFEARHRKKLLREVTESFIGQGKIKTENLTLKNTKTKTRQKPKKVTGGSALLIAQKAKSRRTSRRRTSSTGFDPLQMVAMINKKLPEVVRKNMDAPALENRTGRFANSVKVTDISKTPKGFPSIGYTYQRRPYGVFEVGGGKEPWATPERDPRTLIDRSIRDIAAQFAIGRFYTRRL